MKRLISVLVFVLIFFFFVSGVIGCAQIKEFAKGAAGLSTKVLEEGRPCAIKEIVDCQYNKCYKQVKDGFLEKGSYIYAEDEKAGMIAIYLSGEDTTPVGVFFVKINEDQTQVEISSPNIHARELISARVFSVFKERPIEVRESAQAPQEASAEPDTEENLVMEGEVVADQ